MNDKQLAFKMLGIASMLSGATKGHEAEVMGYAVEDLEDLAEKVYHNAKQEWEEDLSQWLAREGR